jgi:hypothetical protein
VKSVCWCASIQNFITRKRILYEIITPTNAPKNIYNFILKNLLHVLSYATSLKGKMKPRVHSNLTIYTQP